MNKIVRAVQRCCAGLAHVDPMRVASRTIGGLYDGATTRELDSISIQTAAALISEEPRVFQAGGAFVALHHHQRSLQPEYLFLFAVDRSRSSRRCSVEICRGVCDAELAQAERCYQ